MSNEWNNNGNNNQNGYTSQDDYYNQNGYNGFNQNNGEQDYAFQTLMRNGKPKTIGWSVASLVTGILSVVTCCFGWSGLILGVAAIVFSVLSRRALGYFDGLSIAGLVLGIFGGMFGIVMLWLAYGTDEAFWQEFYEQYYNELEGGGDI